MNLEDFLEEFETINFSGKCVAMFGLGDQVGYADNFLDAVGIIAKIVISNGGTIVGKWPIDGYDFDESLALTDDGDYFYGLGIDDDNQDDKDDGRHTEELFKLLSSNYSNKNKEEVEQQQCLLVAWLQRFTKS